MEALLGGEYVYRVEYHHQDGVCIWLRGDCGRWVPAFQAKEAA